jgi:hypothetical protein
MVHAAFITWESSLVLVPHMSSVDDISTFAPITFSAMKRSFMVTGPVQEARAAVKKFVDLPARNPLPHL